MSGNIQGGQKTRQKLIDKLGEAEYSEARIARLEVLIGDKEEIK